MADIEKRLYRKRTDSQPLCVERQDQAGTIRKERAALDFKKAESMGYNKEVIKELLKLTMNN